MRYLAVALLGLLAWGAALGAPLAFGATGPVRVAVLDTGCQWEHEGLAGRVDVALGWSAPWLDSAFDAVAPGQDDHYNGHGTKVCGIASQHATAIPIKVCSYTGQCADVAGPDVDGVVAGIDYAVASGARVINASITSRLYSQSIQDAVTRARVAGVVVVAAAGNSGIYTDADYPLGAAQGMIVVGGSYGSPSGAALWPQSTRSSYVDLLAPALGILSASCASDYVRAGSFPCWVVYPPDYFYAPYRGLPVYEAGSGTSFATPLVSDAVVRMLTANPALGTAQVEEILRATARPVTCPADGGCGAGVLDADAAVLAAIAAVPTPTPTPSPTATPSPTPTVTATPTATPTPTCWPPSAKRCRPSPRSTLAGRR